MASERWMHELHFSGPPATDEEGPYDAVIEHAVSLGFTFEGGHSAQEDTFERDGDRVDELETRVATLTEALAFYADEANYRMEIRNAPATGERYGAPGPIARDGGSRARAALAGAGRST